jgi:putative ABC transport system substrate-binding protein
MSVWSNAEMRRRDLFTLVGGVAATWPLVARGQQLPVVGFINAASAKSYTRQLAAFLEGMREAGYTVGQNVAIEYRWADGKNDQLPAIVADLVRREVTVIAATSTPAAIAAKRANTAIPIIFETGSDPIRLGLIPSLNRPGGNMTGVTNLNFEIAPKRVQLLHELIPSASVVALLTNPANPALAETATKEVQAAARALGLELHVLNASVDSDIERAFANLTEIRAGGLVIGPDTFFNSRIEQLAALALHHLVPTIYEWREFAVAGGLVSYGPAIADSYRLAGNYVGRVLKGDKPADLPVQQVTRFEMFINLKTAKALGVSVPNTLAGRADELIE